MQTHPDVGNRVQDDLSDHITCSNQRFGSCSPTVDVGYMELMSGNFCGNGLQDEYSVLLLPVLQ
jgi:hypothetical protein